MCLNKQLAFLLGTMGENYLGAKVHAYGSIYDTGAAVIEFKINWLSRLDSSLRRAATKRNFEQVFRNNLSEDASQIFSWCYCI